MKPRCLVIAIVVVLALGGLLTHECWARKSPKGSDAEIRAWVLQQTPIGSTRKHVMATIEREHWICHPWYEGSGGSEAREWGRHRYHFKCCGEVGSYHAFYPPFFIWPCRVVACWLFGADDRLAQVLVSQACEGL
jgi:hypothetical protein